MNVQWVYVVLLAVLVIAGVLCGTDRLTQENFMTIAMTVVTAVLSGTAAYYYALSKVKDNEGKS